MIKALGLDQGPGPQEVNVGIRRAYNHRDMAAVQGDVNSQTHAALQHVECACILISRVQPLVVGVDFEVFLAALPASSSGIWTDARSLQKFVFSTLSARKDLDRWLLCVSCLLL